MIEKLRIERFKNFREAEITLGPLTVLIGTNASGKSNLRDAFRFLHGVWRGYTLDEILGEKYGPGGEIVWKGIRGGPREAAFKKSETFVLEVTTGDISEQVNPFIQVFDYSGPAKYQVEVAPGYGSEHSKLVRESLQIGHQLIFEATVNEKTDRGQFDLYLPGVKTPLKQPFSANRPVLPRLTDFTSELKEASISVVTGVLPIVLAISDYLYHMRFLELTPEALRQPSFPGQSTLGNRGEHLASVLQAICADTKRKQTLISWIRELTPTDLVDFDFVTDYLGKVTLLLEEEDKRKVSAYSASDGTLRFLAMLATLLTPQPARLNFFEEIENGLHPSRLYLILDFIQKQVTGESKVIASSHSPQLLRFLNAESRDNVALIYRLPGSPAARIKQLRDFPPDARKVIEGKDLAELHDSGWFENTALFMEEEWNK
jgi:predicted ATPase